MVLTPAWVLAAACPAAALTVSSTPIFPPVHGCSRLCASILPDQRGLPARGPGGNGSARLPRGVQRRKARGGSRPLRDSATLRRLTHGRQVREPVAVGDVRLPPTA